MGGAIGRTGSTEDIGNLDGGVHRSGGEWRLRRNEDAKVRLYKANDRLIGHSISWVRPDIFGSTPPPSREFLAHGSLYSWLRENLAVDIRGGVEFIEAQSASSEVAHQLQLEPGTALLIVTRIAKAARDLPIEFVVVTYRADRYRFRLEL